LFVILKDLFGEINPNPAVVFEGADLTGSSWKKTCLNRSRVNKTITPRFIFKNANLSNADFSEARFIHPSTQKHMTMQQVVVDVAMREEPIPFFTEGYTASQAKKFKQDQTKLKDALKNLFEDTGHLKNKLPRFIIDQEKNDNFVQDVLNMKPRTFDHD
jgi:uncharacterized protein YPO0396